jgi:hypothetical protein
MIGTNKLVKEKSMFEDIFIKNIKNNILKLLESYQFELEKYYFIYQNEKNLNKTNISSIQNVIIDQNTKWSKQMKLNKINIYF